MRYVVLDVCAALKKYAHEESWNEDEYSIYYHINVDWDVVNVIFVSMHFDGDDERKAYLAVWRFLSDHFKGAPEILKYFTLLVESQSKVDEGGVHSIAPSFREFPLSGPVLQL
jgi:hypothetical protein